MTVSDSDDRWRLPCPELLVSTSIVKSPTNFLAMRTFLLICNVYDNYDNYDNTVIIIIIYHHAVVD